VYVCGGYTDEKKRSNKIDFFSPAEHKWYTADFRLPIGFEGGSLISTAKNEIILIGGKTYGGDCNTVVKINLFRKDVCSLPPMQHGRVLHKCIYVPNQKVIVLGGC
jgi:N-acetylneuraminic acid mutarotase